MTCLIWFNSFKRSLGFYFVTHYHTTIVHVYRTCILISAIYNLTCKSYDNLDNFSFSIIKAIMDGELDFQKQFTIISAKLI